MEPETTTDFLRVRCVVGLRLDDAEIRVWSEGSLAASLPILRPSQSLPGYDSGEKWKRQRCS